MPKAFLRRIGKRPSSPAVTVIVPVYGDYDATRACLDSLRPQLDARRGRRAVLVDDATPDPRIRAILQELGRTAEFAENSVER